MRTLRSTVPLALFSAAPLLAADLKEPAPIWQWLNFLILAGVLGYLVSKSRPDTGGPDEEDPGGPRGR